MRELLLEIKQVTAIRGERLLFADLSFKLFSGELLHIEGPNGAGKTTLLRMICGFALPEKGEIYWKGRPLAERWERFRRELLYLGHHPGLKEELTPEENLKVLLALHPGASEELEAALREIGLEERSSVPVRLLSAGQKQRVALARLLLQKATLWVLDEPFSSLDRRTSRWLCDQFRRHLQRGGAIVLTSHQPLSGFGPELKRLDLTEFANPAESRPQ